MVSQRTLRRKLQKKKKHKPFRLCDGCGLRMKMTLVEGDHDGWHFFKHCGGRMESKNLCRAGNTMQCLFFEERGCGRWEELRWSGGGIGRHIPLIGDDLEGKA